MKFLYLPSFAICISVSLANAQSLPSRESMIDPYEQVYLMGFSQKELFKADKENYYSHLNTHSTIKETASKITYISKEKLINLVAAIMLTMR